MDYVVAGTVGYLLGSILVCPMVACRHGVDIRRAGSGNPGSWNTLLALGPRRAWPAFLGDGAKALAAGLVGLALGGWWVAWTAVAAAMVGHALPLYHRGRGGKAVMCFAGGAFALSPLAALACLGLSGLVTARRGFKLGARVGVGAFPLVQLTTDPVAHVAACGALMTLIGVLLVLRRDRPAPASAVPDAGSTT